MIGKNMKANSRWVRARPGPLVTALQTQNSDTVSLKKNKTQTQTQYIISGISLKN